MPFLDYCLMPTLSLRIAEPHDAEAIAAIYNHEVEHETSTLTWCPAQLMNNERGWRRERECSR